MAPWDAMNGTMDGTGPFGYSFLNGQDDDDDTDTHLLSDSQQASLRNFFHSNPDAFSPQGPFPIADENTTGPDGYSLAPPPSVLDVSMQSALYNDNTFSSGFIPNTQPPVQPTSLFYNNAQAGLQTSGPYSTPGSLGMTSTAGLPTSGPYSTSASLGMTSSMMVTAPLPALAGGIRNRLAIQTQHGTIPEPLAAMLPLHSERGSVDAQLAEHFSQIPYTDAGLMSPRPALTRSYTYGTDTRFNQSGYTPVTQGAEDSVVNRLIGDTTNAFRPYDEIPAQFAHLVAPIKMETAAESLHGSGGIEAYTPAPSRRKNSKSKNVSFESPAARASSSPNSTAGRKRPSAQESKQPKKKKATATASGAQRQNRTNLTDEQKRQNHIKSEQKRRNVINNDFAKLNSLIPACLKGNHNKSTSLMEAANFLDELFRSNKEHEHYLRGQGERAHP